jgi:hypothetical protein
LSFGFKEVEISNGDFVLTIQKNKEELIGEYHIWVDLGIEMLQKCKEYFLLKTDLKSEERADAIGQVLETFKNK